MTSNLALPQHVALYVDSLYLVSNKDVFFGISAVPNSAATDMFSFGVDFNSTYVVPVSCTVSSMDVFCDAVAMSAFVGGTLNFNIYLNAALQTTVSVPTPLAAYENAPVDAQFSISTNTFTPFAVLAADTLKVEIDTSSIGSYAGGAEISVVLRCA